jgi:hypothetical protein
MICFKQRRSSGHVAYGNARGSVGDSAGQVLIRSGDILLEQSRYAARPAIKPYEAVRLRC